MKSSELEEGKWYQIKYREHLKQRRVRYGAYSYDAGYECKLEPGIGQLIKKKTGHSPHHEFDVDGKTVFSTPNSIIKEVPRPILAGKGSMLDTDLAQDLDKLRNMGLDDDTRRREINVAQTILTDLGVTLEVDKDCTHGKLDYLSMISLKFLALKLLKASMEA